MSIRRPIKELTWEEARRQIHYDPETGICTWKLTKPRAAKGSRAGWVHPKHGYRRIKVCKKFYQEHRFIWFWMTGTWPKELIDHKNRQRADNRWENLREATYVDNRANALRTSANQNIECKISSRTGEIRWDVSATYEYRQILKASYATREEAKAALEAVLREKHGAFYRIEGEPI